MALTSLSPILGLLGVPTTAYLFGRSSGANLVRVGAEQPAIPLLRFSPLALAAIKVPAGVGSEQPSCLLPLSAITSLRQLLEYGCGYPPEPLSGITSSWAGSPTTRTLPTSTALLPQGCVPPRPSPLLLTLASRQRLVVKSLQTQIGVSCPSPTAQVPPEYGSRGAPIREGSAWP